MHISPSQTIWVKLILQFMDERNKKKWERQKRKKKRKPFTTSICDVLTLTFVDSGHER